MNHILAASSTPSIALTFDEGPSPQWTPAVLDVLARHAVTATFCVVGDQVPGCEALLSYVVAEGHVLGNHTESPHFGGDRSAAVAALETLIPLLQSVRYTFVGLPQ